jgi:hypothetical protein
MVTEILAVQYSTFARPDQLLNMLSVRRTPIDASSVWAGNDGPTTTAIKEAA